MIRLYVISWKLVPQFFHVSNNWLIFCQLTKKIKRERDWQTDIIINRVVILSTPRMYMSVTYITRMTLFLLLLPYCLKYSIISFEEKKIHWLKISHSQERRFKYIIWYSPHSDGFRFIFQTFFLRRKKNERERERQFLRNKNEPINISLSLSLPFYLLLVSFIHTLPWISERKATSRTNVFFLFF